MPFPVPGLPDVTLSHDEVLLADHAQSGAVTVKAPLAPSLLKTALAGEISTVHTPVPSSVTVTA